MNKEIQDELLGALIGLARATEGTEPTESTYQVIKESLYKYTDVSLSNDEALYLINKIRSEKEILVPECSKCQAPCGRNDEYDMQKLWNANDDVRVTKISILNKIHEIANRVYSAKEELKSNEVDNMLCEALFMIGYAENKEMLQPIINKISTIADKGEV